MTAKLETKLENYEVLIGLLGVYMEKRKTDEVAERSKLYRAVYDIYSKAKDSIFDFEFRTRSGEIISHDVDLGLRNLYECKRLKLINYSERRITNLLKEEYKKDVKPRIVKMGLLDCFEYACDTYLK